MNMLKATIPNAGTTSNELDVEEDLVAGVFLPSALTGVVNIQVYNEIDKAWANALLLDGSVGTYTPIAPADSAGWQKIRCFSNAPEAAARVFTFSLR
jgi:hypothetical protein